MEAPSCGAGDRAGSASFCSVAGEQRALFEITFAAGLGKSGHPELWDAGGRVLGILAGPAEALRHEPSEALALVHAVGAVAHGYGAFLHEGVFGPLPEANRHAEDGARRAARTLAERPV